MGDNSMSSLSASMLMFDDFETRNLPIFEKQPDEKYMCANCKKLLRPPIKQTKCGHRLCDECVNKMFEQQEEMPCPGDEDCVILQKHEVWF